MAFNKINLLIIASSFPTDDAPAIGVYVMNLATKFRQAGINVKILVPVPIHRKSPSYKSYLHEWREHLIHFKFFKLPYLNIAAIDRLINLFNLHLCAQSAVRVVNSVSLDLSSKPLLYGHFIQNGVIASIVAEKLNTDYAVALGESGADSFSRKYTQSHLVQFFKRAKSIICVSEKLKSDIQRLCSTRLSNCGVFPNRANEDVFYPRSQIDSRKALNIPLNIKVIVFIGQFINRKGYAHLVSILKRRLDLHGIFIGNGNPPKKTSNILYSGSMKNEDIPTWLAAADVFVLPTHAEGSCNAIAEAIAMGKPLVVSNVSEVLEQVNLQSAVTVDPYDESSIERGIDLYFSSKDEYDSNALSAASCETLQRRALNILNTLF